MLTKEEKDNIFFKYKDMAVKRYSLPFRKYKGYFNEEIAQNAQYLLYKNLDKFYNKAIVKNINISTIVYSNMFWIGYRDLSNYKNKLELPKRLVNKKLFVGYESDNNINDIEDRLDTYQVIKNSLHRYYNTKKESSKWHTKVVIDYLTNRYTLREIAEKYNISFQRVHQIIKEFKDILKERKDYVF